MQKRATFYHLALCFVSGQYSHKSELVDSDVSQDDFDDHQNEEIDQFGD